MDNTALASGNQVKAPQNPTFIKHLSDLWLKEALNLFSERAVYPRDKVATSAHGMEIFLALPDVCKALVEAAKKDGPFVCSNPKAEGIIVDALKERRERKASPYKDSGNLQTHKSLVAAYLNVSQGYKVTPFGIEAYKISENMLEPIPSN